MSNDGNGNNKDNLYDSGFRSSVQIEQSWTCVDIETILKELDVEYNNEQESKQSNNKHHVKKRFQKLHANQFWCSHKDLQLDVSRN